MKQLIIPIIIIGLHSSCSSSNDVPVIQSSFSTTTRAIDSAKGDSSCSSDLVKMPSTRTQTFYDFDDKVAYKGIEFGRYCLDIQKELGLTRKKKNHVWRITNPEYLEFAYIKFDTGNVLYTHDDRFSSVILKSPDSNKNAYKEISKMLIYLFGRSDFGEYSNGGNAWTGRNIAITVFPFNDEVILIIESRYLNKLEKEYSHRKDI